MNTVTANELRRMILDDRELALLDACSLYVFDVRTREEYEAGHLHDARWVAGGQLVQAADQHIGTLRVGDVVRDGAAAWQRMEEGGGR